MRVAASSAVPTGHGGTSGGVAVLVPTWGRWRPASSIQLVPGYALAVELHRSGEVYWVVTVHLPPGRATELIPRLAAACAAAWPEGRAGAPLWVAGDFNLTRDGASPADVTLRNLVVSMACKEPVPYIPPTLRTHLPG